MRCKRRGSPIVPFGPRWGSERCGTRPAVHAVAERWTGIGVVAACVAGAFIVLWPRLQMMHSMCGSTFSQT
jgi:hypothetical protein